MTIRKLLQISHVQLFLRLGEIHFDQEAIIMKHFSWEHCHACFNVLHKESSPLRAVPRPSIFALKVILQIKDPLKAS